MDLGKTALLFAGGGMKCVSEVGPLKAIKERGIPIHGAQAISGGMFNMLKYFTDGYERVEKDWLSVDAQGPGSVFKSGIRTYGRGIFGYNALFTHEGLEKLFDKIDFEKVVNCPIPLEVVVCNEGLEELEVKLNHDFRGVGGMKLCREFCKASASLRGLLPPVTINGEDYSDPCEFEFESFRDFDTLIILDTDQPHVAHKLTDARFYERMFKQISASNNRSNGRGLELFREHYGFRIFPDPKKDASMSAWVKSAFRTIIGKPANKRVIEINPGINIPTLTTSSFGPGDIPSMVKHSYERANQIFDMVEAAG